MKKLLLGAVAAAFSLSFAVGESQAQDKPIFALVPKHQQPVLRPGPRRLQEGRRGELGDIECSYIGPGEHGGGEEQVQVVRRGCTRRGRYRRFPVERGCHGRSAARGEGCRHSGSHRQRSVAREPDLRVAYVGTKNYDIGVNPAKRAMELKPDGGTLCIQSGRRGGCQSQRAHAGIRDTLHGAATPEPRASA
ncbi:MAG: hypothetical protein R3C97_03140 [Geminicoccaceae bacterium]